MIWGLILTLAGLTALSFTGALWVPGELASHFPVQWAALGAGLALFAFFRNARRAALAALVLAGLHAALIGSWHISAPPPAVAGALEAPSLRVLTFNMFGDATDVTALSALLGAEEPDLISLTEVTGSSRTALQGSLAQSHPHMMSTGTKPSDITLFSRFPLRNVQTMGSAGVPLVRIEIETRAGPVEVFSLHPPTPLHGLRMRDRHLELAADQAASAGIPAILMGDFNVTPYSPSFRRLLERSGLVDTGRGRNWEATWLSRFPLFGLPIDHILVSPEITVAERKVMGWLGSDHRPVLAELRVPMAKGVQ